MADFSQPGSDPALPLAANEWRRGLVYTANSELPCPLRRGQQYRISIAFKQKTGTSQQFRGYGDMYQRITAIAQARISQLTCPCQQGPLHTWIECHGWRHLDDTHEIATAFTTMGLICPKLGDTNPEGEDAPAAEALLVPGGATDEMLARFAPQRSNEIYNEFDFTDTSAPSIGPVILSYGEPVPACEGTNFQPFVRRAEEFARFYHGVLQHRAGPRTDPFKIMRREWYCVTDPNLVTVHVHFQA